MTTDADIKALDTKLASLTVAERLQEISALCDSPVFTTSLGREDQYLLSEIARSAVPIRVATLQTGRLFAETETLIEDSIAHFGIAIAMIEPDRDAVRALVASDGENGFYDSVAARKRCCHVRKIAPLAKALDGADGWVTGMTRAQSPGRSAVPFAQWDEGQGLIKFNPLADLSDEQLDAAIAAFAVPVNPLHARGYPSIGCAPCTRAIKPGEHPRAGRWWWEQNTSSECGLHTPVSQPSDEHASQAS